MYPEDLWVKVDGKLNQIISEIDTREINEVNSISYPENLVSSALLGSIATGGVDFEIYRDDGIPIRKLDNQSGGVYGGGILLREAQAKAQAQAQAKEVVMLSDRERNMLDELQKEWDLKHGKK